MISIIIPTYNEQKRIFRLLNSLQALPGAKEIIVVDGGSTDDTRMLAKKMAKVLLCKHANRAKQMNQGALSAKGEILWFLHADSKVCKKSLLLIKNASQNYSYGGFALCFDDSKKLSLQIIAFFSNIRAKFFGIIFGDQAMFVRKNFFFELGGFKNKELMEDFDFSQRAKQVAKSTLLKGKIQTSARRFLEGGVWKTCWKMQYIKLLYLCGVSTQKLKAIYTKK